MIETPAGVPPSLQTILESALEAVCPERAVLSALVGFSQERPISVVGLGKASPRMALGARTALGDSITRGLVVTPYGYGVELPGISCMQSGHPLPDEASVKAGEALLEFVRATPPEHQILALISGGGSAAAVLPTAGLQLADLVAVNQVLIASGLPIEDINAVRIALSRIKGGRLLAASRAPVTTLVLSDVIGGGPELVASGPMSRVDPDGFARARIVAKSLGLSDRISDAMQPPPIVGTYEMRVVADVRRACEAAARAAAVAGFQAEIESTTVVGSARSFGEHVARSAERLRPGECVIWGGETTVELGEDFGEGGRNHEVALSALVSCDLGPDVWIATFATDGVDGHSGAAGVAFSGNLADVSSAQGLDPDRMLDRHDSGTFFAALGAQILTGPTGTNVNDITVVLRSQI